MRICLRITVQVSDLPAHSYPGLRFSEPTNQKKRIVVRITIQVFDSQSPQLGTQFFELCLGGAKHSGSTNTQFSEDTVGKPWIQVNEHVQRVRPHLVSVVDVHIRDEDVFSMTKNWISC